jgi:uncharacterized protein
MSQALEVQSKDLARVAAVASAPGELVVQAGLNERGTRFDATAAQYRFARLEDLKADVLAEATRNAQERAKLIASAAGARLGRLLSAQLGDIQMADPGMPASYPYYSDDSSSRERDIIANVVLVFVLE